MRDKSAWGAIVLSAITLSFMMLFMQGAFPKDWADSPHHSWYEAQQPTPETQQEYAIAWKSCCAVGDVCQECVVHRYTDKAPYADGWWYTREGVTKRLPDHLVAVVPWTPTGKPVLFLAPFNSGKIKAGEPVCLKIIGGGV